MAVDSAPVPEKKGGIPLWVIIAGGAGLGLLLYLHNKRSAASAGAAPGTGVVGQVTDPNTGLPIDPLTGLPYVGNVPQPQTLDQWAIGAEGWLSSHGVSPSLANQAVYDYTQGNLLNANEAGAIDKLLGGFGYPPQTLPFGGNPVLPKPNPLPKPTPTAAPPPHIVSSNYSQFISALQQKLVAIPKGGGVQYGAPVYAMTGSAFGPLYAQGSAVQQAKATGGTLYTLPEFAQYTYGPRAA